MITVGASLTNRNSMTLRNCLFKLEKETKNDIKTLFINSDSDCFLMVSWRGFLCVNVTKDSEDYLRYNYSNGRLHKTKMDLEIKTTDERNVRCRVAKMMGLLCLILDYLESRSAIEMQLVCRKWYEQVMPKLFTNRYSKRSHATKIKFNCETRAIRLFNAFDLTNRVRKYKWLNLRSEQLR